MIRLIHGKGVGAGKSYLAAKIIAGYLANGATVCLFGFHVKFEGMRTYIESEYGVTIEESQIIYYEGELVDMSAQTPMGTEDQSVLCVIDEAQVGLHTRDISENNKGSKKRAFFNAITQSRHDDKDWLFITQDMNNVDANIRRLVTFVISVMNVQQMSVLGLSMAWVPVFRASYYGGTNNVPEKEDWMWKDKRIYASYTSKSMRGVNPSKGIAQKKTLKKHNKTMLGNIIKIGLVLLICWGSWMWANRDKNPIMKGDPFMVKGAKQGVSASEYPQKSQQIDNQARTVMQADAYQVEREVLLSTWSTGLRTKNDTYEIGRMSGRGLVQYIQDRVVRLSTPSGGLLYVVACDEAVVHAPKATPTAIQIVPTPAPVVSQEHADIMRVRAGLPPR